MLMKKVIELNLYHNLPFKRETLQYQKLCEYLMKWCPNDTNAVHMDSQIKKG